MRRRLFSDTRGAAAVEFALIGIPLVFLVIGIVEFGRGLYIRNALDDVADRAQRAILINPDISDAALTTVVRADFRAGPPARLEVTHSDETSSASDYRLVSVRYDMNLLIPSPVGQTISIASTRRVAVD